MHETRRCQMLVPTRFLTVATKGIMTMPGQTSQLMGTLKAARFAALVLLVVVLAAGRADAAEVTKIRVNTFPNAKALPVHVALAKGLFAKYGLAVELENTESSQSQRAGLAA